jgi:hypothetical protein
LSTIPSDPGTAWFLKLLLVDSKFFFQLMYKK